MCNKSGSSSIDDGQRKCVANKKKEFTRVSLKPSRKSRTKTRKPKFLSLRLAISPQNSTQMMTNPHHRQQQQQQQQQLNLFPLHPENLVEDHKDIHDDNNNVAFLFDTTSDSTATLHDLLDSSAATPSSDDASLSPSLTFGGYGRQHDSCEEYGGGLVRTAMRCKGREPSEEKWVCYSEVVERIKEEEVTSSAVEDMNRDSWIKKQGKGRLLALKLDYEEILNAWSDKGSLYIEGECPQTVPDLHDGANVLMDGWGSIGNLWSVPEMAWNVGSCKMEEEMGEQEDWKRGQREASVLRYKEKRQSRLFSKRIRYEVRKLNAEKRPRMKGRFVKRSLEE